MSYGKENNDVIHMVFDQFLHENNKNFNFILDYIPWTSCGKFEMINEEISDSKLLENLESWINIISHNESHKQELKLQGFPHHILICLDNLYDVYTKFKISDVIRLVLPEDLTDTDLHELQGRIELFANVDVKVIPEITTVNLDLINDEHPVFKLVVSNNGTLNFILNKDTWPQWEQIDKQISDVPCPNICLIDSVNNTEEEQLQYYLDLVAKKFEGCQTDRLYSTLYDSNLYQCIRLNFAKTFQCDLQQSINIHVPSLSLLGCPYLNGETFILGKLTEKELISNNLEFAISVAGPLQDMLPKCTKCQIREVCQHGCLKANFDREHDILISDDNYCEKQKQKVQTLIDKYQAADLISYIAALAEEN